MLSWITINSCPVLVCRLLPTELSILEKFRVTFPHPNAVLVSPSRVSVLAKVPEFTKVFLERTYAYAYTNAI